MENRRPTGPGSRGGTYHLPGARARYDRAWRAANPAYRERERLRMHRRRHGPDALLEPAEPLRPALTCACGCGCREAVVTVCGFCRDGLHGARS